jgi:hypothetical protein
LLSYVPESACSYAFACLSVVNPPRLVRNRRVTIKTTSLAPGSREASLNRRAWSFDLGLPTVATD